MKTSITQGALIGAILLSTASCAGAVPWNKQIFAGIEEWSVEYEEGAIKRVHYINGKEIGSSTIKIALMDGTVLNFAGNDIAAFKGQELRAEVEKIVAEQVGAVAPEVVTQVIEALKGGGGS